MTGNVMTEVRTGTERTTTGAPIAAEEIGAS